MHSWIQCQGVPGAIYMYLYVECYFSRSTSDSILHCSFCIILSTQDPVSDCILIYSIYGYTVGFRTCPLGSYHGGILLFPCLSINVIQLCKCFILLFHTRVWRTRPILMHAPKYGKIKGTSVCLSSIYSNKCFTVC